MAIKVTLESGTIVEGTADELVEYLRLAKEVMEEKDGPTSEKIYDKPARVGDTIRITDAHMLCIGDDYNNGDVMTVERVCEDGEVQGTDKYRGLILPSEFEIIGRESEEEEFEDSPEITVGKRYKLTKDGRYGDIKKGERVVVARSDSDGEYRVDRIDARNRDFDYVNAEDLTEIKPREGDIVRVTGTTNGHDVGTIGVVTGVRYDGVMGVRAMYNGSMSTFIEHSTELVALKEVRSDV